MKNEIEVEIRGNLDDAQCDRLKKFLDENGVHQESHEREMFLLFDYPGFSDGFVGRQTDIRLRNTNGQCEIMLKQKTENARKEVSLKLKDNHLETAKEIVKAFGCNDALWMHRLKEIYMYHDVEWSLVIAPNNIRYYEAEIAVETQDKVAIASDKLSDEAEKLGLEVLDDEGTAALIERLDTLANKKVKL